MEGTNNEEDLQPDNNQTPSRVILVCVYNINGTFIGHDTIYQEFNPYGGVEKVRNNSD